jgi:hypothetical protein
MKETALAIQQADSSKAGSSKYTTLAQACPGRMFANSLRGILLAYNHAASFLGMLLLSYNNHSCISSTPCLHAARLIVVSVCRTDSIRLYKI